MSQSRSRIVVGLAIAVATIGPVWLGSGPGRAAEGNVGAWDLKVQGGERECRVMLRSEIVSSGYAVAMPVGCRRAFPILKAVAIWTDTGDGRVQLDDTAGQPVLLFEPGPDGVLTGTSPEGEIYRLEQSGPHRDLTRRVAAAPLAAAAPASAAPPAALDVPEPSVLVPAGPRVPAAVTAAAVPPPVAPLRTPRPSEMAGYFSVLREKTRDTGCMVTLDDKNHGPSGSLKAHLAPACRDQGIIIFDPVGWQLAGGRLVLTARKGHTAKFDLQPDGSWLKDPSDGKSLSLKKM